MRPPALAVLLAAAALAASACRKDPPADAERIPPDQRAVDSTIGASKLPGAGGVRGAMAASDSAARRAKTLDSLSKQP